MMYVLCYPTFVMYSWMKTLSILTFLWIHALDKTKNFTVIHLLHCLCTVKGRFESITVHFPVRGHSYMEPDKDMGNINQKVSLELPDDWIDHIAGSCSQPFPFRVVKCDQSMFLNWQEYFPNIHYRRKAQFETRPIKEIGSIHNILRHSSIDSITMEAGYHPFSRTMERRELQETKASRDYIQHLCK